MSGLPGARLPSSWLAGLWRSCRPLLWAPKLPEPQLAAPDLGPPPRTRPPRWARAPCAPPPVPPLPNPGPRWVWSSVIYTGYGGDRRSRWKNPPVRPPSCSALAGAARCSLWLDPSWAAPRCCVPQTPRLAAAPAHKLVGNKIAFSGCDCANIPDLTRKDLSLLTWTLRPLLTSAENS